MTLNMTVLTPTAIYQSADFRLTDPNDVSFVWDESAKTVVLRYMLWSGFVTYTGIGSWNDVNLSEMVADWMTGIHSPSMADVAAILEREGTALLQELERRNRIRFPQTFTLAGFEDNLARAYVISNFEDCYGRTRPSENRLTPTKIELDSHSDPFVIVTGRPKAIPNADKRFLRELAGRNPLDGGLIRRKIQELNAQASKTPESGGSVSEDCVVISFRFDGFGILDPAPTAGAGPKHIPIISSGINQHKFFEDAMAKMGLDMSNAQMGNATFVSTHMPGPVGSLQSTCKFPILHSEDSGGYEIREIVGSDFEPMFAYDVNEAGDVVGTGRDEQVVPWTRQVPWIMRGGEVSKLNYEGSAWAINRDGLITATPTASGTQDVALHADGAIMPLPIQGAGVASVGATRSSGGKINSHGVIAGSVCDQTGHNMRAAAFQASHDPMVLTELAAQFGTRAVDINDQNQVLVLVSVGPGDVRSVLWNLESGTWSFVGGDSANITPVAMTNSGLVLGRSSNGGSFAMVCEPDGVWQPLGTGDGWTPQAINDLGDVVGFFEHGNLLQPWLRLATGEQFLLPSVIGHTTDPKAINNDGVIVGTASADHGGHAVIWRRTATSLQS